jgi:dihydroneopterin triphosphate diphosphatase
MTEIKCKIVEVCVFSKKNGIPHYLLLKRSSTDTLYPGIWQTITGGIRDGEKAYEAAYREMREETQLLPHRFFVGPHVSTFYDPKNDVVHLSPLFAAEVKTDSIANLSHEHEAFHWCQYDEAHELLVWPGQKQGLDIVHGYIANESKAGGLLDISEKLSL